MATKRRRPGASRSVFINCPFDDAYKPLLQAMIFTIIACGYKPRCAQERQDSSEYRLNKIIDIIGECDWGIHDISRVEVDPVDPVPRFNMPMELGIHLGARRLGEPRHRRKRALVLESKSHRYDQTLSDISGQDVSHHGNKPEKLISAVRDFFNDNRSRHDPPLPGGTALISDYKKFKGTIGPAVAKRLRLGKLSALSYRDYEYLVEVGLEVIEKQR